jgi:hypothetical protein
MSVLAAPASATGLQLPLVPEPVTLKRALRALAEVAPRRAAELLVDPGEVAGLLWERWGPDLERAQIGCDAFFEIVAEYRRELWYWLWGNRTWAHCSGGLAGRLARRTGSDRHGAFAIASEPRRDKGG